MFVSRRLSLALATALFLALLAPLPAHAQRNDAAPPEPLVKLFIEWRAFQRARLIDGVPDYSTTAMARQAAALPAMRRRLTAMDTTGWSVPQQVDWHLVRAEMNGLDFDHRVLRPWANNPAFYLSVFDEQSDQPAREGHQVDGSIELWQYKFPLSAQAADSLGRALRTVAPLLAQARRNLVGNGKDLWVMGAGAMREQEGIISALVSELNGAPGSVRADAEKAREATASFATWVEQKAKAKTGPSGIGIANYDWYLKNVQLVPYTWAEEVQIMERELARSRAYLALDEVRNAALPPLAPVASAEEHTRRFEPAVDEYIAWLRDHQYLTIKEWMAPALKARVGRFSPGAREFFTEVDYRDPMVMRTHGYHWFDIGRMVNDPHPDPIRRGPLLYNIFVTRTEGHATGWEETMLGAGMFDKHPRSDELIHILLAQRGARALGDLRMHANQATLEEAATMASKNTPRNWLRLSGNTVRHEQFLYLQQPAYGTSYVIGKVLDDRLLSEVHHARGDAFKMREFMDAFDAAGLIPMTLLRWEMTGKLDDDVKRMLRSR